jgi:3-hydroxybutyryl-CoA dehydrogenase
LFVFKAAVVGAGTMGGEIAQVVVAAGIPVVLKDVKQEFVDTGLEKAREVTEAQLASLVKKEKITQEDADSQREEIVGRITGTTDYDGFGDVDFVIEAVPERMEIKQSVFSELDEVTPGHAILASNTSSLSITEMMTATRPERQARFVGLHFFNPVPLMKLVEVVRTILTDEEVYESAVEFGRKLGKVPVRADDRSGFIVNRLLVPYLLDSIRALEEGVGSIVDIDNGMKLGCGHPMGPLTLLDFVGLDTTYYIAEIMFEEFREKRFAPPPLLKRMVKAGLYGRKSGRGFYDYTDPKKPVPMSLV